MKLWEAHENFQRLQRHIAEWRGTGDTHALTSQIDQQTGEHWVFIEPRRSIPQIKWAVIIGDIVHNLRTALDHLIWELAVLRRGEPPPHPLPSGSPWRSLQFPVYDDASDFFNISSKSAKKGQPPGQGGLASLQHVRPAAAARVIQLQPFQVGDRQHHPLRVLQDLDNIDKHRTLHLTGVAAILPGVEYPASISVDRIFRWERGPFTDKALLLYNRVSPPESVGSVKVYQNFRLDIAFGEGPPVFGGGLIDTLTVLYEFVSCLLLRFDEDFGDIPAAKATKPNPWPRSHPTPLP